MSAVAEALVFLTLVAVVAVVAIRVGMLLAPRLDRMTTTDDDEDDRGDTA